MLFWHLTKSTQQSCAVLHISRGSSLRPATGGRCTVGYSSLSGQSGSNTGSPGTTRGEGRDKAVRNMRAMAGGHTATNYGQLAAAASDPRAAISPHRRGLRRSSSTKDDQRARPPRLQGVSRGLRLLELEGRAPRASRLRLHGGNVPGDVAAIHAAVFAAASTATAVPTSSGPTLSFGLFSPPATQSGGSLTS